MLLSQMGSTWQGDYQDVCIANFLRIWEQSRDKLQPKKNEPGSFPEACGKVHFPKGRFSVILVYPFNGIILTMYDAIMAKMVSLITTVTLQSHWNCHHANI